MSTSTREQAAAVLHAALGALVGWQDGVNARRGAPPHHCRVGHGRPLCPMCRGRVALKRAGLAGLEAALRLLVLDWERRTGACDGLDAPEPCACLLCEARRALRARSRLRHGHDIGGPRRRKHGPAEKRYGDLCRAGHTLTPETASYHSNGRATAHRTLRCLICCRQRNKGRQTLRRHKRVPGMCGYGLHAMTPENTYHKPNGERRCRTCMRIQRRSYWHRRQA